MRTQKWHQRKVPGVTDVLVASLGSVHVTKKKESKKMRVSTKTLCRWAPYKDVPTNFSVMTQTTKYSSHETVDLKSLEEAVSSEYRLAIKGTVPAAG